MLLVFNDPHHWHERANDARSVAEHISDIERRARMMAIADQFDKLAERAVARLKANAVVPPVARPCET